MDMFLALAEPTRRNIVQMLAENGELAASDICEKFHVTAPAISQHLKVLREANVVNVEKRAQQRIYSINKSSMGEMEEWFQHMRALWSVRFDALEELLKEEMAKERSKRSKTKKVRKK